MAVRGIALGFPADETERQRLRDMAEGHALPAILPRSQRTKCVVCGMEIWVGPRVWEAMQLLGADPHCPVDAARAAIKSGALHLNMNNPDSKFENE